MAESPIGICCGTDCENISVLNRIKLVFRIADLCSINHQGVSPLVGNDWHNIHKFVEHKNLFYLFFQILMLIF